MGISKYIGRVGALAVALGVGVATVFPPLVASAEPADSDTNPRDSVALILGGTTVPTPDQYLIDIVKNQYILPTHPDQAIVDYVPVTTPQEFWPLTGFIRLVGVMLGPPSVWGPGGAGWWPDEPWWKLSGLFDLTIGQSFEVGVADLEKVMADHPDKNLIIYGASQGAIIANMEKQKLAEQYPDPETGPDVDFVLHASPHIPNGGLFTRFPRVYIPILDFPFVSPAHTDTGFDTVMINRQYDGLADFPLYPVNLIADLNAILGLAVYVHPYSWDVSLPAVDPERSPAFQGKHGDTSYYFFETEDLPLFGPLRTLGVPEPLIDVVEPVFRVIVELGYDRTIPVWEPTPARLIPRLDLQTVVADLVDAIGEGIDNAFALVGAGAKQSHLAEHTDGRARKVFSRHAWTAKKKTTDPDQQQTTESDQLSPDKQTTHPDQAKPRRQHTTHPDQAKPRRQHTTHTDQAKPRRQHTTHTDQAS